MPYASWMAASNALATTSVQSLGIGTASFSRSSAAVENTGAACANSGNTTRRTARNGALPATAYAATLPRIAHHLRSGQTAFVSGALSLAPLWLAELELTHAEQAVAIPDWLAPFLEREVTDDPSYTNRALAR